MTLVTSMPSMTLTEAFEAFPNIEKVLVLRTDMTRMGIEYTRAARDEINKLEDIHFRGADIFS
ncbi:MAG: hypothetical protein HY673_12960, partial [Chloroflexi bacterium]|nr:hypothetical protein [Chloroflexota bacterium]